MSHATYIPGSASGGYPTPSNPTSTDEGIYIYWPPIRPAHFAKGAILLIHGAGGSALAVGSGGSYEALANYLCNVGGYVVAAVDAGSNGNQGAAATTNPDTYANNVAMAALDAAFKWATDSWATGTSTGTAATTMTDTGQAWRTNQWTGRAITCGGKTGVIASNTPTVLTLTAAGWAGGTPASTSAYSIAGHSADAWPNGKTGKVILVGVSMGGWIARNWASRNPSKVACILDIAGIIDGQFSYTIGGSSLDLAYGPAAPPSAPSTPTGTAGATSYAYKTVETSSIGDGPPSAASPTAASLVTQATLGASPNTLAGITHPASTAQEPVITATKILRSVAAGAFLLTDTVGNTTLTAATGLSAITSLTVAALPFAIPNGCVMQLASGGTTQNVTLSAGAAANATTLTVTSFTPSINFPIGSTVKLVTYIDRVTASGSAYTPIGATGAAYAGSAYQVNGVNASPSYDPQVASNLPAGLKAIKCQYWWSANDGTTSTGGVPGTVNSQVATYQALYGANMTLQEVPGDPVHNSILPALGTSTGSLVTIGQFIDANAP